ncbi:MAG TPA: glycosyltransferase [Thermoanaerobaculia bacterium]|nr:glycosyltransferase [Thermoanaerobaculia bacterium]
MTSHSRRLFLRRLAQPLLSLARRVLPRRTKRWLKRFWDPNQILTVDEARFLASVRSASRDHAGALRRYDLICFSIVDWDFRWQRPQQLMTELARRGHRIFYISRTRASGNRERCFDSREVARNVHEVALRLPKPLEDYEHDGAARREAVASALESLRRLRRDFRIHSAVSVVEISGWTEIAAAARDDFGWRIAYDCMDEWVNFPGVAPSLIEAEQDLVELADLVIVTGARLEAKWREKSRAIVLARNATDFDHFERMPDLTPLDGIDSPRIGYFGAIAEWLDLDLILHAADERPRYNFVLVGGVFGVSTARLASRPNVHLLGQKPYELIPAYLRQFDVCIIPFRINPITEATDPVKLYEYFTLGKPVVATALPELSIHDDALYVARDAEEFVARLDEAVGESDPARVARRIELARENTWSARVDVIEAGVAACHPKASIIVITFGNLEHTRLCLASLEEKTLYPGHEVIVIDNASEDGTQEYLRTLERRGSIRAILNETNRGFAAAVNQGLAAAEGESLVILNNDVVVAGGWLSRLLRHLDDGEVGLAVSITNFSGNESRIDVTYSTLDEMEEFASAYMAEHDGEHFAIRVAAMYCVAMRRAVHAEVGALDERFTIGMFEDDDYSHRVRLAGYRVVCAEDSFVHHFGQASFRKLSNDEYQALWRRNQQLYEEKWGIAWEAHRGRG